MGKLNKWIMLCTLILICGIVGVLRALIEKKITKKGSEEK